MFSVNVEKYIRFLFKAILVPRIMHCFFQSSYALPSMLHFPISISWNFLGKHLCMEDIAQCRGNSSFEKFRSVAIALWQYDQKMNGRDQPILSNVISHMSSRWVNIGVRVTKRAIIFVRKIKDILLWKFDSYEARLFFVKQMQKSCILNGVFWIYNSGTPLMFVRKSSCCRKLKKMQSH